jgi:hypothetical protein
VIKSMELLLGYEPETGLLWRLDAAGQPIRKLKTWVFNKELSQIGTMAVRIAPGQKRQSTHCMVFIMTGAWPPPGMVVDHRNRDATDMRYVNLRVCTPSQNSQNTDRSSTRWNGLSDGLVQGVRKMPNGTYGVQVSRTYCGQYPTAAEANAVARRVRRELYGEYDLLEGRLRRI